MHRLGPVQELQVLLVHPGGPFWARRDLGAWSIPKGEYAGDEDPLAAARREFVEELGIEPPGGVARPLGEVRQRGGKVVAAWSLRGDLDTSHVISNTVETEWPRGSGRHISFPEVDRAEWFTVTEARRRVLDAQIAFLDRLIDQLAESGEGHLGGEDPCDDDS